MNFSVRGISKSYQGRRVLNDVSFSFSSSDRLIIMGPSGCGKTTLCRILAGLERPDSGTLQGFDLLRLSMVFQEDRLCSHLSAVENAALPLQKKDTAPAFEALTKLGVTKEDLSKPVVQLSGGQKRRAALARAMLAPGELVILDEPFKGLDAENRLRAASFILDMQQGRSLICVTHEAVEADLLHGKTLLLPMSGGIS
ncbi:MAG: ATP-binding cassette domain-containing protein [Oscillospiraceae bacterium]|nr:ATP-binding cassette domain-containing protein [Oscillospiraceae bacterium]